MHNVNVDTFFPQETANRGLTMLMERVRSFTVPRVLLRFQQVLHSHYCSAVWVFTPVLLLNLFRRDSVEVSCDISLHAPPRAVGLCSKRHYSRSIFLFMLLLCLFREPQLKRSAASRAFFPLPHKSSTCICNTSLSKSSFRYNLNHLESFPFNQTVLSLSSYSFGTAISAKGGLETLFNVN